MTDPMKKDLPEGVESEIYIQMLKTGGIVIQAPGIGPDELLAMLIQAAINLNQETTANKTLIMMEKYLQHRSNQQKIVDSVRGAKPS